MPSRRTRISWQRQKTIICMPLTVGDDWENEIEEGKWKTVRESEGWTLKKNDSTRQFCFLIYSAVKKFCITCKMRARLNLFACKASR